MVSRAPSASLVRPAQESDATRIGEIHAAGMLRQVGAGLGRVVPAEVAGLLDAEQFAAGWRTSIAEPPSAKHRVLVALNGERVVGFAAFGPAGDSGGAPEGDDDGAGDPEEEADAAPEVDAEIIALEVDPAQPFDLHSARLLNACADILALSGASSMRTWAVRGDELRQRFLTESGFAVLGLRRGYQVGDGQVVEDAWWAEIGDPAP